MLDSVQSDLVMRTTHQYLRSIRNDLPRADQVHDQMARRDIETSWQPFERWMDAERPRPVRRIDLQLNNQDEIGFDVVVIAQILRLFARWLKQPWLLALADMLSKLGVMNVIEQRKWINIIDTLRRERPPEEPPAAAEQAPAPEPNRKPAAPTSGSDAFDFFKI